MMKELPLKDPKLILFVRVLLIFFPLILLADLNVSNILRLVSFDGFCVAMLLVYKRFGREISY